MAVTDGLRLLHMRDAAREVVEFAAGRARADLDSDRTLTLALTQLVEIIGEAAVNVSEATRLQHPEIPWRRIAATRNQLIHGYYRVNLDILWRLVSEDVPALLPLVEAVASEEDA